MHLESAPERHSVAAVTGSFLQEREHVVVDDVEHLSRFEIFEQ
jgi:hypothetical protein